VESSEEKQEDRGVTHRKTWEGGRVPAVKDQWDYLRIVGVKENARGDAGLFRQKTDGEGGKGVSRSIWGRTKPAYVKKGCCKEGRK